MIIDLRVVEVNDQNNPRPIAFVPNFVFEGVVKYEDLENAGDHQDANQIDVQMSRQPICFCDGEIDLMMTAKNLVMIQYCNIQWLEVDANFMLLWNYFILYSESIEMFMMTNVYAAFAARP